MLLAVGEAASRHGEQWTVEEEEGEKGRGRRVEGDVFRWLPQGALVMFLCFCGFCANGGLFLAFRLRYESLSRPLSLMPFPFSFTICLSMKPQSSSY